MTNGLRRVAFTAITFALLTIPAHAATQRYSAQLKASSVVPAANSAGHGILSATFDTETKVMSFIIKFEGLTGPATSAHFHGPADKGTNAGVVLPVGGSNPIGPIIGSANLTDVQIEGLQANKWYVDVHTSAYPVGEIRGQIVKILKTAKKTGGGGKQK